MRRSGTLGLIARRAGPAASSPARAAKARRPRRLEAARRKGLAQRQEVEQQFDDDARVAAEMTAIGQDLALELVRQCGLETPQPALLAVEADRGEETLSTSL